MTARSLRLRLHHLILPLSLGLLTASASVLAYLHLSQTEHQAQQAILESQVDQIERLIETRLSRYQTLLRAATALFAGTEQVSRAHWRAFLDQTRALDTGLHELLWIEEVSRIDLPALQQRLADEGFLDFAPRPAGERDVYCLVVYVEPLERYSDSLGIDACTRPASQLAALRSRLQRNIAISGPVNLIDAVDQPILGYVLFDWVERGVEQSPGWAAATIAVDSIFGPVAEAYPQLQLEIVDSTSSAATRTLLAQRPDDQEVNLSVSRTLSLGGRQLQLRVGHDWQAEPALRLALIAGLVIAVLLSLLLYAILRTRARAELTAETATQAARESENLLQSVTDNITEGIYRGEPETGLVYINQALAAMFGFDSTEAMMRQPGPILYASPNVREKLHQMLIHEGEYRNQEVEFVRPDGTHFFAINSAVATCDADGQILYFDGVVSDITERKRAEEEVHRLAHYDALTGLPNRTLLNDRIRQAIALAGRKARKVTVMFMDLDRFKAVNDSLGHQVGDELLIAVSQRLSEELRQYDTISRLGGDEFVVLMPDAGPEVAAYKAESIIQDFRQPFRIAGHELIITPSIGIAVFPDDSHEPEVLLRHADTAMYHAKERGRATFQFFTSELNERAYERLTMETHLRSALTNGELSLVYQPILSARPQRIIGAEALLRWNSPVLGQVSPADFIEVAEQSGLIIDIGDWVIRKALAQLARWRRLGMLDTTVSINVSAVQFWRGGLEQTIQSALDDSDLQAHDLEIEITENVIMSDVDMARDMLARLKALGVSLAIDDFGTGYSSLSYLKQFRIDRLKIDQSFIRELSADNDDAAIVSAVLSMAQDLRLSVTAEGVESESQLAFLRDRGCPCLQGYYFSKPLAPNDFLRLWARGNGR